MAAVVITGADGFIGSHLARYCAEQGMEVYAVVLPGSSLKKRVEGLPHVTVIQKELHAWRDWLTQLPQEPHAVIHLAWNGVAPEARGDTELQMSNLALCADAVRLAGALRAQRFILPGSTMEYAYCGQMINEQACPSPQNAYGCAKLAARFLCEAMCQELKVPYIYAVITGIYAADRQDNNVVFYTISQLLERKRPSLTELKQPWDYVHIDDVVNAVYLIAQKGKGGAFYAIGHGDNWPLFRYVYMIRDLIDPELPLGIGDVPYQNGRIPSSCVDLSRLQEDTGFEPKISFETGIQTVIQEIKKQSAFSEVRHG